MDADTFKQQALEDQIKEELSINDSDIQEELKRQPNKYFYWSIVRAKGGERTRQKRMQLKEVQARLGRELRSTMNDVKVKVTERMLDDYLAEHPENKKAVNELIKAEYTEELLEACVEAFKERHYALLEIARSRESEKIMKNEFDVMRKELEAQNRRK